MNILKYTLLTLLLLLTWQAATAQTYTFDLSQTNVPVISGHLKLGTNKNPKGETLDANSLYFTRNGKPWYPVMGEIHFSRFPREQWEEAILKMKAAGIDVIASYIIWIYHEEEEGKFNWSGNNDLRAFVELCQKHDMYFFSRIGPWVHGEVRNGGFPDWLVQRGNTRRNDPAYLASVQQFYNEIGRQLSGLYFKDGGTVIGAQIENEFRFNNPTGLEHMLTLKKLAIEAGIDVPFYSATGWPGSNQQQDELIPVWGAYPEAPWDKKTTKLPLSPNYLFGSLRNDPAIGSDLFGSHEQQTDFRGYRYPYATAEMGGGNQITYHRRPIIEAPDVTALTYVKVGSGANLMGYYMFHGGSNPIGKNSTLQESKATKYPNNYPIISYDFLAPLGEWGQTRPSYRGFKVIHTFLNEFGDRLVQYGTAFPDKAPEKPDNTALLRVAVRAKENSGFVFISNFQRQLEMQDIDNVLFELKLKEGSLRFPEQPFTVKKGVQMVLPFNMDLDGLNLNYATAQPLCRIAGNEPLYVFFAPEGVQATYSFDKKQIKAAALTDAVTAEKSSSYSIRAGKPGTNCLATLTLANGKKIKILTLTHQQALDAWKADVFGAEHLFISGQDLMFTQSGIRTQSTANPKMMVKAYPAVKSLSTSPGKLHSTTDGIFTSYTISVPAKKPQIKVKEVNDISAYQNKGPQLPLDDRNNTVNTPASPGPQYQTNLTHVEGARYYELQVPSSLLKGLKDAFITINYTGDTGAAYADGKLIADDFYSGLPMTIGARRFSANLPVKKLLLQLVPLKDERQIYFEDGVREPLKGRDVAELKSVQLVPVYEVELTQGK